MDIKVKHIYLANGSSRLRAVASVQLDEELAIHDIKIIEQREGCKTKYKIAFPARKDNNGVYRDCVHPINQKLRQDIEKSVLGAFFIQKNKLLKTEESQNEHENISSY